MIQSFEFADVDLWKYMPDLSEDETTIHEQHEFGDVFYLMFSELSVSRKSVCEPV